MLDVVFVEDTQRFCFKHEGKTLKRDSAVKYLLEEHSDTFSTYSSAHAFLDDIQENNKATKRQLKAEKAEQDALDWDALYAELSSKLPVLYAITDNAVKMLFTCTPNREVRKVNFKTIDDAVVALQKDVKVWVGLKDYYRNSPHLTPLHRLKMPFIPFVKQLVSHYLLADETKQIQPEDIKRISWDESEYAYKKFDITQVQPGPTPAWDEFTSRLDYPEVFRAWVWSVVEPSNNIRQAIWLVGEGNDGKSAAQNALTALLGKPYVKAMQDGELHEKFFLSGVYGKTLINYADAREIYLFNHPKIKQITGGDTTSIEFKGQDSFAGDVYSKLFITSNKNPKINPDSRAQLTRLIRLEVSKPKTQDAGFQSRLEAEIWPFLHQCREAYEQYISPGHNRLMLPQDLEDKIIELCSSSSHQLMISFIRNHIEYDPDSYTPMADFRRWASEYAINQNVERSQIKHILDDVEEKLSMNGVQVKQKLHDKKLTIVYQGIKLVGDL